MKILICDDHKIVREGLRKILQQQKDITLIMEAENAKEVIGLIKEHTFDILLQDISLPDRNGLEVLQMVKKKSPKTNILILSMHPEEQYAIRALKLGASGYLTKNTASEELMLAINNVVKGEKYITKSLAENLSVYLNSNHNQKNHESLSDREFDILIKLAAGKTLQEIGDELFISNKTVSTYKSRIIEKMHFKNSAEITKYCIEHNLI